VISGEDVGVGERKCKFQESGIKVRHSGGCPWQRSGKRSKNQGERKKTSMAIGFLLSAIRGKH